MSHKAVDYTRETGASHEAVGGRKGCSGGGKCLPNEEKEGLRCGEIRFLGNARRML